jgi:hypothetical protein
MDIFRNVLNTMFHPNRLSIDEIVFVVNSDLMDKLKEKIKSDKILLIRINKLINKYSEYTCKYYSNNFLLKKLNTKYSDLIKIIDLSIPKNQENFTPLEVLEIVNNSILNSSYFNRKWSVIIGSKYKVIQKNSRIYIGDRIISSAKIKSILLHELFVHVYRSEKFYKISNDSKIDNYLVFEEGLAKMFETLNSKNENNPKFGLTPFLLVLSEIGLSVQDLEKIMDLLKFNKLKKMKFYKNKSTKSHTKFKTLNYFIGFQKLQYFSTNYEQSKFENEILYSAFDKITNILMEYKFSPLDFEHIRILISNNLLDLTNSEKIEYKIFTNLKETKKINNLIKRPLIKDSLLS